MARYGGFFGPWEFWRRIVLVLIVVMFIVLHQLFTLPIGLAALVCFVLAAQVWKGIGMTNPDLGAYTINTHPHRLAEFFMIYRLMKRKILSPLVALGAGVPDPDPDHDLEPGWFPATRLSFYWCLGLAILVGMVDAVVYQFITPFWRNSAIMLPVWAQVLVSIASWLMLFQSIVAVWRLRTGRGMAILAIEPAPAVILSQANMNVSINREIGKAVLIGLAISTLVFGIAAFYQATLPVFLALTLGIFVLIGMIAFSLAITVKYRERWQERNDRRNLWQNVLVFLKDRVPSLVLEVTLPTIEEWEEQPHADDEPYAPNVHVATFAFASNSGFSDYLGIEERINNGIGAKQSAVVPIPEVDLDTGNVIPGSISNQGFRIWWSESIYSPQDALRWDIDEWEREFIVRAVILPIIGSIRNVGFCNLVRSNMMTRRKSQVQLLEVEVTPMQNVSLATFMTSIQSITEQLGFAWVRAFKRDRSSPNVTFMMGDDPTIPNVKAMFQNPPSIVREQIDKANFGYIFFITGIVGPDGNTPDLIKRRPSTAMVDELNFEMPEGFAFEQLMSRIGPLKSQSLNHFMEISQDQIGKDDDQTNDLTRQKRASFTIVASRRDPLDRLFPFEEYRDRIITGREEGIEKIEWSPGVMANDDLAIDNFDSAEPHLLIGGSSGSGKSIALANMILQLAANNGPGEINFWIAEPKIGAQRFAELDVVTKLVDSWTPTGEFYSDIYDMSQAGVDEMLRRNKILKSHRKMPEKLEQARRYARNEGPLPDGSPNPLMMPFIVIIVEECATVYTGALSKDDKEMQSMAVENFGRIHREGRSSGIYMVSLTQYPTNASIPSLYRQQSRRIGLASQNSLASQVIIDENGLEKLRVKGTGMIKQGYGYRQFRGYYLQDGDVDLGERNDVMDELAKLPKNTGMAAPSTESSWIGSGRTLVEAPKPEVFSEWARASAGDLDRLIEAEKMSKDPSILRQRFADSYDDKGRVRRE